MYARKIRIAPRLTAAVLAALVIGAASTAVVAAPRDHDQRHAKGPRSAMLGVAFDRIDANGDGVVTRAEYDAHVAARRAGLDADGDGFVTFEETKAWRQAQREARARERFAALDIDGDGRVSVEEADARGGALFERLDRDGDGQISREELRPKRWRKEG